MAFALLARRDAPEPIARHVLPDLPELTALLATPVISALYAIVAIPNIPKLPDFVCSKNVTVAQ